MPVLMPMQLRVRMQVQLQVRMQVQHNFRGLLTLISMAVTTLWSKARGAVPPRRAARSAAGTPAEPAFARPAAP
ncbi:hypothetical protein Ssi02_50170 [Sinosporangium siamense]|uniref:Uncharacterized protein n=1 Tax=Sinosporangium siamense TaxID=1367973 RepID=A0A919V901_9ACTN|nr:hypothetical protein Ssi02_50170 [Sinosporangium siamense]